LKNAFQMLKRIFCLQVNLEQILLNNVYYSCEWEQDRRW
jgi:hypothetical protein